MDDLVHYCLRELSFDGDLGSNVSRLRDFIIDFYAQPETRHLQNPDDAFCAFVWSLVVRQPTIRVGTIPEGLTSGVWIAPQTSKKKKAKERGEEHVDLKHPELDLIPDAASRSLESLVEEFGDRLRIAVEPNAIYAAITGSHIRFAKLSPMVYSALQIITRGRDGGVSVVSIGKESGYDQKTCFYLIKQLQELNLVVKVPKPGVGTNFVIHRYFFDKSPHWKAIREEEHQAEEEDKIVRQPNEEEEEDSAKPSIDFGPIDARHLSSLPLVKSRVVKLLKASKNYIHESNNMLITLGFSNPTKTDRRFFQSRIKELIQQGVIEKVVVPSSRKKSTRASVKCFRLVTPESKPEGVVLDTQDDEVEEEEATNFEKEVCGVKMNVTIHKQIFHLLEESGTHGMTLSELSTALCHFDKRTIELLLARADRVSPPPQLSDLGIAGLMETSGRERRHRYYTVAAYRKLVAQEQLDPSSAGFNNVDFTRVGEFSAPDLAAFYENEAALVQYQDAYKAEASSVARKKKPPKNPVLPDGTIKLGRPRKVAGDKASPKRKLDHLEDSASVSAPTKRRRLGGDEQTQAEAKIPKRRGRPPKNKSEVVTFTPMKPGESTSTSKAQGTPSRVPAKKRSTAVMDSDSPRRSKRRRDMGRDDLPLVRSANSTGHQTVDPVSSTQLVDSHTRNKPSTGSAGEEGPAIHARPQAQPATDMPDAPSSGEVITTPTDSVLVSDTSQQMALNVRDSPSVYVVGHLQNFPIKAHAMRTESTTPVDIKSMSAKNRINVSHLRREGEMYRIIESFGGIINTQSKEFSNAHATLLETLAQAGEPSSAPPGTKTDKRTVIAALDALEGRGKIKQLRTSVQTHTGINRPARIAYLPTVTEPQLKQYLADLSKALQPVPQAASFVKIDERVEYGADSTSISRSSLPLQLLQLEQPGTDKKERWSKNIARANQLFAYDDETIRDVLLAERTTLGQLYGFIVGKIARIRALHILALQAFGSSQSSPNVVSKEHKIIDLSFFCYDISLADYCSLVSCLTHSKELSDFFTAEGRRTAVRDLPPHLYSLVQVGRSRARSRFLEMLEVLRLLGITTPLQPSKSEHPGIVCEANGHTMIFEDASLEGWTTSTPMIAPSFWKFNDSAPIHFWRESETSPSFWKSLAINTPSAASEFWDTLRIASIEATSSGNEPANGVQPATSVNVSLARSLRRPGSWNSNYVLTWHQMQYLKQFIDIYSAETPVEEADDEIREPLIERICRVSSAPREAVVVFYGEVRERLLRELNKAKQKGKRASGVEKRARRAAEVKELLAKKAAEARRKREQEWDALLLRVHPGLLSSGALSRVKRVEKRFLEAGSTQETEKWKGDIIGAIREADMVKMLKITNKQPANGTSHLAPPPPIVLNPLEPSVESLILKQGSSVGIKDVPKKKRNRGKNRDTESGDIDKALVKASRRHRFQWNRDYDELARDAAAIIRARCRNIARVDWAAFEQVFPSVPRNTVRQRLAHIREAPGNEAFMNRLEDKWYELWVQHRGTPLLPDDEPQSTSQFDLAKHIEFLRKHIDKNALRVGYGHTRENDTVIIPSTVQQLLDEYEVDVTKGQCLTWDFMWNANVEEGREKGLMRQAFNQTVEEIPSTFETVSEPVRLAEAALKMTLGTPSERYDASQGALILQSVGQKNVEAAAKSMLARGTLSKLVRDPQKTTPGRHLKISDMNLNNIGGSIPKDTFQDAVALEELVSHEVAWREWPLTATDGDCVALIELVMENKLDFKIDTTEAQAARSTLDWNSKKADDDQIETTIWYTRTALDGQLGSDIELEDTSLAATHLDEVSGHGVTIHGEVASCRCTAGDDSLVDCKACLTAERNNLDKHSGPEEREIFNKVLGLVGDAGESGLTLSMLQAAVKMSNNNLLDTVQKLTKPTVPMIYWSGYASSLLVSAPFVKSWSIKISESPVVRIFPRRWLDTQGRQVVEYWQAALKAVVGLVIFRPGISQTEITWRLKSIYDRQEVHDIIRHLIKQGFLRIQISAEDGGFQDAARPYDRSEGRHVFYFIGDRRWYQV